MRPPLSPIKVLALYLLCFSCSVIEVKHAFFGGEKRTSFHSFLVAKIKQQAESSSSVWNAYSVTFFSGCAEVEIWAL